MQEQVDNELYENAFTMFVCMYRGGVNANQFMYISVLRACTSLRCLRLGEQIQGCVEKGRFMMNLFVKCALLGLHSKCGKMKDASYLFESMPMRDVVSWNAMINGFYVQGLAKDGFRMFRSMMREGGVPDSITLGSILKIAATLGDFLNVNQIHMFVIQLGFEAHNSSLIGSLIDAYAKCGNVKNAYCLYQSMPQKDIVSYTALITGFSHQGHYNVDVLELFNEITRFRIDDVLLCSMLCISANTASLNLGKQIHAIASKHLNIYDIAMSNALINMYAKSGEIEDARRVFDETREKNVITWTSLIAGYGKHGCICDAIKLFKQMEQEGLKPNDVTFLSLLFACNHTGLTDEGWKLFNVMVSKYHVTPQNEHASCLVDLRARKGWLEEAYNIISSMRPDTSLWGAFLGACQKYNDSSLGKLAATHLFDMDPKKSVNYVVLANIYAESGAWNNAQEIQNLMNMRSLRKNPGGMGSDFRLLVRKSRKQAEQYHRLYKPILSSYHMFSKNLTEATNELCKFSYHGGVAVSISANIIVSGVFSELSFNNRRLEATEPIPFTQLVWETAAVMQDFTQSGGARPFGVSLLVAACRVIPSHLVHISPGKLQPCGNMCLMPWLFLRSGEFDSVAFDRNCL
ncbi:hypothetical protein ACFE04_011771 [Oxalis oulophora]